VRAMDPARSFHHRRSQHAGFAQHLQGDAATDNIHDGIHRADFVEMHLVRRQAMNLTLGHRDALENIHRFFLHPIRKRAVENQFFDLRESAVVLVLALVSMTVTMIMPVVMVSMRMRMGMLYTIIMGVLMLMFMFMMIVSAMLMMFMEVDIEL